MSGHKLPKGMKIPNFGSLAETNATIRVPKGAPKKRATTAAELRFGIEPVSPFVKIEGSQFVKDCRPFYPTGFNAFELYILAAGGSGACRGLLDVGVDVGVGVGVGVGVCVSRPAVCGFGSAAWCI